MWKNTKSSETWLWKIYSHFYYALLLWFMHFQQQRFNQEHTAKCTWNSFLVLGGLCDPGTSRFLGLSCNFQFKILMSFEICFCWYQLCKYLFATTITIMAQCHEPFVFDVWCHCVDLIEIFILNQHQNMILLTSIKKYFYWIINIFLIFPIHCFQPFCANAAARDKYGQFNWTTTKISLRKSIFDQQ